MSIYPILQNKIESERELWDAQLEKLKPNLWYPNTLQAQKHIEESNLVQTFLGELPFNIPREWIRFVVDNFKPICPCGHKNKKMVEIFYENPGLTNPLPQNTSITYGAPFEKVHGHSLDLSNPLENVLPIFERQENFSTDVTEKLGNSVKSEYFSPKANCMQSKWKNCYALILGRVVKSCKEYFRLSRQANLFCEIIGNSRLNYIHQKLDNGVIDRGSFENYLKSYRNRESNEKRKRGKNAMLEFLLEGGENGVLLASLIREFLTEENLDLQSYINDFRKPKSQIICILSSPKDLAQLRDKFDEMEKIVQNNKDQNFRS